MAQVEIISGPSKFDLMLALFTGSIVKFSVSSKPYIDAVMNDKDIRLISKPPKVIAGKFSCMITEITMELDGTRENIKLKGFFTEVREKNMNGRLFNGYFSMKERTGFLRW